MPTKNEIQAVLELCQSRCEKLEAANAAHVKNIADLMQELEVKKNSVDLWSGKYSDLRKEMEQFHSIFDGLDVPRKHKPKESESWTSDTELTLATRWIWYFQQHEREKLFGPRIETGRY